MSHSTRTLRKPSRSLQGFLRDLTVRMAHSVVVAVFLSLAVVTIAAATLWLTLPGFINTLSSLLAMFYAMVFFASSIAVSKARANCVMGLSSIEALMWAVPPMLVYLSCGVLYFSLFVVGLAVMPLVAFAGMFYGLLAARAGVAYWQTALSNFGYDLTYRVIERALIALQWVAILATWPLFLSFLDLLAYFGIKAGWS